MTLAEIVQRYKGEWVLIEYRSLDRNLEVVEGDVIAHARSKEEIYGLLLTVGRGKNTAIEYCGEWPTDIAVMFCLPTICRSQARLMACWVWTCWSRCGRESTPQQLRSNSSDWLLVRLSICT